MVGEESVAVEDKRASRYLLPGRATDMARFTCMSRKMVATLDRVLSLVHLLGMLGLRAALLGVVWLMAWNGEVLASIGSGSSHNFAKRFADETADAHPSVNCGRTCGSVEGEVML